MNFKGPPPFPIITASVSRLPHLAQRNFRSFSGPVALAGADDCLQVSGALVVTGRAPNAGRTWTGIDLLRRHQAVASKVADLGPHLTPISPDVILSPVNGFGCCLAVVLAAGYSRSSSLVS